MAIMKELEPVREAIIEYLLEEPENKIDSSKLGRSAKTLTPPR